MGALLALALTAAIFLLLGKPTMTTVGPALVVYCAHDSIYADSILREFEKKTGIHIRVRYDSEATKSLGLEELLIQEKDAPRCDVFWNNNVLGTMALAEHGILEPYKGSGWERIPAQFKDPQGLWAGFAARLRVYILNTSRVPDIAAFLAKPIAPSHLAMAKPLYGTTLTHYTTLWKVWGGERTKAWHSDCLAKGMREAPGNAGVKDLVTAGVCDVGVVDTDDFFEAKDDGKPVAMVPVMIGESGTIGNVPTDAQQPICIPNSVAIIRGAPNAGDARKLVDYLLSEECEMALAKSRSRQIPLGLGDEAKLPPEVRELKAWASKARPLGDLTTARAECLAWLKSEYLQ